MHEGVGELSSEILVNLGEGVRFRRKEVEEPVEQVEHVYSVDEDQRLLEVEFHQDVYLVVVEEDVVASVHSLELQVLRKRHHLIASFELIRDELPYDSVIDDVQNEGVGFVVNLHRLVTLSLVVELVEGRHKLQGQLHLD